MGLLIKTNLWSLCICARLSISLRSMSLLVMRQRFSRLGSMSEQSVSFEILLLEMISDWSLG